jgi:dihydroflavonol-4-reductase
MIEDLVLVTGGSGFVAVHSIDQLLRAGYNVRTTVRSLMREPEVRAMLTHAGSPSQESLSFVTADLSHDEGWPKAVAGCRYVLHVASPLPSAHPKTEDELILPACEGTLRVLRAARDAGVQRVVMTSSFAAIGYGHGAQVTHFDESTWTNIDGSGVSAYTKSKALAERAAWDFIEREGAALELAAINPVVILGPTLGPDLSATIVMIRRLLDGSAPVCPRISFGIVDVRDVADLHLRAMTDPHAKGQRFLAVAGDTISMLDVATVLKERMGAVADRAPTRELPDWITRFLAIFNSDMKLVTPELGIKKISSNEKAKRTLGWTPRSNEEAIVAAGESLIDLGLLKK